MSLVKGTKIELVPLLTARLDVGRGTLIVLLLTLIPLLHLVGDQMGVPNFYVKSKK